MANRVVTGGREERSEGTDLGPLRLGASRARCCCSRSSARARVKPSTGVWRGGLLRGVMRAIADGDEYSLPGTIDDAGVVEGVTQALVQLGYAGGGTTTRR